MLACLIVCGEALASAGSGLSGAAPAGAAAWLAAALVVAGAGTLLLNRLLLRPHQAMAAELAQLQQQGAAAQEAVSGRAEQQRRLRHDLRGALSPALLTADRLLNHADPAVKRAADIMVRSVDRAAALLADPPDPGANPPAGP